MWQFGADTCLMLSISVMVHYMKSSKSRILIICMENAALSATSLRLTLEYCGFDVDICYVATSDDFINGVFYPNEVYFATIIDGHGKNGGFIMPDIGRHVPLVYSVKSQVMQAAECRNVIDKIGKTPTTPRLVIALVCTTGTRNWRNLFIHLGVSDYIAYKNYPDGTLAYLYAQYFFYVLKCNEKIDITKAHKLAKEAVKLIPNADDDSRPTRFTRS